MKTKKRKIISLLLAASIIVSTCAVSFTAFAASSADIVSTKIEKLTDPSQLTTALESEYKSLSDTEKEKIDLELLYKLYNYCYTNNGTDTTKYQQTITDLGDYTPNMKAGLALSRQIDRRTKIPYVLDGQNKELVMPSSINWSNPDHVAVYGAYMKLWNDATPYQRGICDLVNNTNLTISGSTKDAFFGTEAGKIPFTTTRAGVLKFYSAYLVNQGKTPEESMKLFVEEFKWSPLAENFVKSYAQSEVYSFYKEYINGTKTGEELYAKFYDTTAKKSTAMDKLEALSSPATIKSLIDFNIFVNYSASADGQVESRLGSANQAATLIDKDVNKIATDIAADIAAKQPALNFIERVKNTVVPETPSKEFNATIVSLIKEAKALIGKYDFKYVQDNYPETIEKYNAIIDVKNVYYSDLINKEGTIHEMFEEEFVSYEMGKPYGDIITESLIPSINSIINTALPTVLDGKNLKGAVENLLFKNENVITVGLAIAGLLGEDSAKQITPEYVADTLRGMSDRGELADRLAQYESWNKLPNDFDWGVVPGDFKSFCLAVLPMTGAIGGMLGLLLPNTLIDSDNDGVFDQVTPMIYERVIIPLLEALGAENVIDSMTFSVNSPAIGATGLTVAETYAAPMMVLEQVYGVVAKLLENPVDFLTKNLPNIVYHLEDGCVFDAIKALLDELGGLIGPIEGVDGFLSLDGIFNLLTPMLEQAGIKLDINDIKKFAHLGKATEVPTASMTHKTTVRVVGNYDSVVAQLAKILEPIALKLLDGIGIDFNVKGEFVRVEVPAYPHDGKMDKKVINNLINGLEETIGGFVNIEDAINGALATNELAGTAITSIYSAIDGLLDSVTGVGIATTPITPKKVAKMFGEAKEFNAITAELNASPTWADVSFTIKNNDGEVIKQVDMGFKDGDFTGFVKTIVASLRPLVELLQQTSLITNTTVNGKTTYGLYETLIIPAFEALGIKPVATSATFTDNFNKLYSKDESAGLDYLVNTIIKPVLTLLEKVEKNPIATIMDVLPNIAYALKYNPTTAFVGNLLLGDKNLADVLNGFIGGLLPGLKLNAINLDALISCGEIKEVNSMTADGGKYKTVVADRADTFVTAFYYLFDTINTGDNLQIIKDLLAGIEMDAGLKSVVDGLVGSLFNMTREEALCTLGATFSDWTCPNAEDENGGNKGTNGKTPGTGDMAISAVAVVSVLFTAGVAIVLLRKKKTVAE